MMNICCLGLVFLEICQFSSQAAILNRLSGGQRNCSATVLLVLQQHLWTEPVTLSTAYVLTTVPFTPCPDEKIIAFRLRTDEDKIVMTSQ